MLTEKFYYANRHKHTIVCVIDNYRDGTSYHGIRSYTLDEITNAITDSRMIVVAVAESTYLSIKTELSNRGFKEFEDFIPLSWLLEDSNVSNAYYNVIGQINGKNVVVI